MEMPMLRWFEHSQVYHPDRYLLMTGAELGRPFEEVSFKSGDGVELHGWFFPAATTSSRARLAVLFCHGNAGNIGHRLDSCEALLETGVSVFLFDYRGYGRSAGVPSELGTYADARAAYRWLQDKGFSGANIIAFGESLGGGVVSELALHEPLGGLVLESSFTSLPDIGAEVFPWLPVHWLATIKYDTITRLPQLKIPILIMHSRGDGLVQFRHAERNFAAANEPKLFWELEGDHNHPLENRPQFIAGIEKLLELIAPAGAQSSSSAR
jgi:uncharacterized protein